MGHYRKLWAARKLILEYPIRPALLILIIVKNVYETIRSLEYMFLTIKCCDHQYKTIFVARDQPNVRFSFNSK